MAKLSSTQIFGNLKVDGEILNKATTTTEGVVQLNDATNSTSTTQAATSNAVKKAYDLAASKANASHGNHVPTTQTANNAIFLRNDNTWQTVKPANIGAAASSHTHNYAGSSSAGGAATSALACTGNSATATKLQTARTINGTAFDGSANITITAAANGGTSAACSGNAATATKLQTARTINGTSFNGSANITTANWGTARTLTVGNTGKSVNGSANVSWSLAEIGAAASSHTHNHLEINNTETKNVGRLQMFQKSSDSTINPDTGWWSVLRTQHAGYTNGYWQEMAYAFNSDTIRFRRNVNGTLSSWKTLAFTDSNVASATKLATARTINGTAFDGSANITITAAANGGTSAACSGNAATATKLQTARTINGVAFDGSANIDIKTAGRGAVASGLYSHAEGYYTTANSQYSHVEGNRSVTSGNQSHAEGYYTEASGDSSHAEGSSTIASGTASHAEGSCTEATGSYSHAEGYYTEASGTASHASGYYTIAQGAYQTAIGKYNVAQGTKTNISFSTDSVFIIGNGVDSNSRRNAFRVAWSGKVYSSGTYNTSGADYAEMFEWSDGNIDGEERIGYFVAFDKGSEKIRKANGSDKHILGIVSCTMAILGDTYDEEWKHKYLRDKWGRIQYEIKEMGEEYDKKGSLVREKYLTEAPILNPDYNEKNEYIPRQQRKEWDAIGLLGKLLVYDDGTCEVGEYCMPNDDGIATKSDTGYYVMSRESENIIKVLFK